LSPIVRKCDRRDAEMLARIARCDEKLLFPIGAGDAEEAV